MKTKLYSLFSSALCVFALTISTALAGGPALDITCLPDSNMGCNPVTLPSPSNPPQLPSYSGDCAPLTLATVFGAISSSGCNRSQTVTYTVSNSCAYQASCTRTFTWKEDNNAPNLDPPGYLTLHCHDNISQISSWLNAYDVDDDCDFSPTVTNNYSAASLPGFCTGGIVVVTWTATDDCGNSVSEMASIYVIQDDENPALDTPSPLTLDCHDNVSQITGWLNSYDTWDNCTTNPTVTNDYSSASLPTFCQGGQVTVHWSATDGCGNTAHQSSYIYVIPDNNEPSIDPPFNHFELDCHDNLNQITGWLNSVDAWDDCDNNPTITNNYTGTLPSFCTGGNVYVTFTATDGCGNTSQASSSFFIIPDNTTPDLFCVGNKTIQCYNANAFDAPDPSDYCALFPLLTVLSTNVTAGPNGTQIHTRTWQATDDCGNTSTCHQSVTMPLPLTVDAGPNKIVYIGYPDSACTKLQSSGVGGGTAPRTLTWSTGSHASFINVCPTTTTVYYLTVTDAHGCSAMDSVKVCVFDVRCGNGLTNVTICHGTGSASNPFITLCVDKSGAKWHFQHHAGEKLGACGMNKSCLFPQERLDYSWDESMIADDIFLGAFPNPFTNSTTIRFMLSEKDFVNVKVFDVAGRVVGNLYDGATEAGEIYSVEFDGSKFSNGMYFLMLNSSSGMMQTRKLILDK